MSFRPHRRGYSSRARCARAGGNVLRGGANRWEWLPGRAGTRPPVTLMADHPPRGEECCRSAGDGGEPHHMAFYHMVRRRTGDDPSRLHGSVEPPRRLSPRPPTASQATRDRWRRSDVVERHEIEIRIVEEPSRSGLGRALSRHRRYRARTGGGPPRRRDRRGIDRAGVQALEPKEDRPDRDLISGL
jgi:hypothetical protein